MRNKLRRKIVAAIGAALILSQAGSGVLVARAARTDYYPPIEKDDSVDGDSISPSLYDVAPLEAAIESLREAIAMEDAEDAVRAAYAELIYQTDEMYTVQSINHIAYYSDVNNEEVVSLYEEMDELCTEYGDLAGIVVSEMMNSPYAYVGEEDMDDINIEYYRDYKPMTERQKEISARETQLTSEYGKLMLEDISVTIDGTEWTESSAEDAYYEDELDYDGYNNVMLAIAKERNRRAGEIYLEMIDLRTEMTEEEGEDNYADWRYRSSYIRDYTTEEIKTVYEQVKTDLVPFYAQVSDDMYSDENIEGLYNLYYMDAATGDDLLASVEGCIYDVSEELGETFTFMREHHLINIEPDPAKSEVGFTTSLYTMGVPYIFYKPYEFFYDYNVVTHEFGHFNHEFHYPEHVLTGNSNMDTAEIHSQGLELLTMGKMGSIFGESLDAYERFVIVNMMDSIVAGCLFDEFQVQVYHNPDMTLDDMNALFFELAYEYGCEDLYDADYEEGKCYGWVDVSHTFEVPMYYISYATSALAALDIYTVYLDDAEEGTDLYMKVTTLGSDVKYRALLEECGMDDVFADGSIAKICEKLENVLYPDAENKVAGSEGTEEEESGGRHRADRDKDTEADTRYPEEESDSSKESDSTGTLMTVVIVALCVIIVILIIVIIAAVKSSRKKHGGATSGAAPNAYPQGGVQGGISPYADSEGKKPR